MSLSSFFFSSLRFQGKNAWMSAGTLPPAAAHCSKYHVSHFRGLSLPHRQRGKDREGRRRQFTAPLRPRAVEVLPRHRRAPPTSFRGVVVHRDPRIVHEPGQSFPMLPQAFQSLSARCRQIRSGQFRLHLRLHLGHGLAQAAIGFAELRRVPSPPPTAAGSTGRARESVAAIPRPTSSIAASLCPPG